jgi:hypothetical protein
MLGVFGQKFVGDQPSVRRFGNDIGKGAAPVDPEFPSAFAHIQSLLPTGPYADQTDHLLTGLAAR